MGMQQCYVSVNQAKTVTAYFDIAVTLTLDLDSTFSGASGSISDISGTGLANCEVGGGFTRTCTFVFPKGFSLDLVANPGSSPPYATAVSFTGCDTASYTNNSTPFGSCAIQLTGDRTIAATFN